MTDTNAAGALLPARILERAVADWQGLRAVSIKLTCHQPLEFNCIEQRHLLVALEGAERYAGETTVEGLPKSTRRDLAHKLTFIPAGCAFSGWMKPLASLRATLFYIDPTLFTLDASILVLVYIGVGGLASTTGSVLGVILLIAFNESLRFLGLPSQFVGPFQQAIYGLLLILLMIFRRRGLVGKYDFTEYRSLH